MIPLATAQSITGADGRATVDIVAPTYTTWLVRRIEVETQQLSNLEPVPELRVYRGVIHPQHQVLSTYQALRNAAEPEQLVITAGEHLYSVFTRAQPSRLVTIRLFGGEQYG